jgi:hypothetical protein
VAVSNCAPIKKGVQLWDDITLADNILSCLKQTATMKSTGDLNNAADE